jgi:hypothetical protein
MRRLSVVAVLACTAALVSFAPAASADVLLIERVAVAKDRDLPRRGSTMTQVHARFGEPKYKHAPVGGGRPEHPPITRWDYQDFSVYFEHSHVVNSVVKRAMAQELSPKPVD